MRYAFMLSGLFAATLAMACSDDEQSGLSPDKQLKDLSADELAQLNEDGEAFAEEAQASVPKDQRCRMDGVYVAATAAITGAATGQTPTDAGLQQSCSQAYDACVEGAPSTTVPYEPVTAKQLEGCTATVGELKTCANERFSAAMAAFADIPACDTLTVANVQSSMSVSYPVPQSCTVVAAKCPGFASAS